MQQEDQILIQKLDEFIRKYYKNQLVKGSLYFAGIVLSIFLTLVLLEYFAEFGTLLRATLFFGFIGISIFVLSKFIVIPGLKLNNIGSRISHQEAANIIGNHFSNVQDKLLNVLQLQKHQNTNTSSEFLIASIHQKINELQPIPFAAAIDLKDNLKYLKYVGPVIIFTILISIIWPQIIAKSTKHFVSYNTSFSPQMPFSFQILNQNLEAIQSQDFKLQLNITGDAIPNEVFVQINNMQFKLEKEDNTHFNYNFSNLQQSLSFNFLAAGFESQTYNLKVLPKPSLMQFNIKLTYPQYLQMENETVTNTGVITFSKRFSSSFCFSKMFSSV